MPGSALELSKKSLVPPVDEPTVGPLLLKIASPALAVS
jgi:hypothetical protein